MPTIEAMGKKHTRKLLVILIGAAHYAANVLMVVKYQPVEKTKKNKRQ